MTIEGFYVQESLDDPDIQRMKPCTLEPRDEGSGAKIGSGCK